MLNPADMESLKKFIRELIESDATRLEELRRQTRDFRNRVHPIRPRTSTVVSIVAADGGDNSFEFDPYMAYVTRVVDSYGKVLFLDTLSPFSDIRALSKRHLEEETPLGRLMRDLGVEKLWELSPMIPSPETPEAEIKPGWVKVYRDLGEWAALYDYLIRGNFPNHTLVVRDGLLRSKIFANDFFPKMWDRIRENLRQVYERDRRKVFVVGLAKRSKVLDRYHLAFFLENVLIQPGACYLEVPARIEREIYKWDEFSRREEGEEHKGEEVKMVQGALFLAKFGPGTFDPIWPVDVWLDHLERGEVDEVFSYLLADAEAGFPKPFYPLCLQKAHEGANLAGFDMEIIRGLIMEAIRENMPKGQEGSIDAFRLYTGGREPREQ